MLDGVTQIGHTNWYAKRCQRNMQNLKNLRPMNGICNAAAHVLQILFSVHRSNCLHFVKLFYLNKSSNFYEIVIICFFCISASHLSIFVLFWLHILGVLGPVFHFRMRWRWCLITAVFVVVHNLLQAVGPGLKTPY